MTAPTIQEIDRSVLAYLEWHRHAGAVQDAWSACASAPGPERPRRFAAYLEQLDREQRACELYEDVLATSS